MIQKFVDRFMAAKPSLREQFEAGHPDHYEDIVKAVVGVISGDEGYGVPDPGRVHMIDDGSYQGLLVFVIGATGYQPYNYWYVLVNYGSCSGCDTLQDIRGYSGDPPTKSQVDDYMTLALHIVQGLKHMGHDTV